MTEFLGNNLTDSDGIAFVDNWHNTQLNDCAHRGEFPGPWIQWSVVRRNTMAGVSDLARHDANASGVPVRCASFALRAAPSANTSDLVAEHQTFRCESGAVAGSYDVSGCDHCTIK